MRRRHVPRLRGARRRRPRGSGSGRGSQVAPPHPTFRDSVIIGASDLAQMNGLGETIRSNKFSVEVTKGRARQKSPKVRGCSRPRRVIIGAHSHAGSRDAGGRHDSRVPLMQWRERQAVEGHGVHGSQMQRGAQGGIKAQAVGDGRVSCVRRGTNREDHERE